MQILGSVVGYRKSKFKHGHNCEHCIIQSVTTTNPLTVVTVKRIIETIKKLELEAKGDMVR